LTGDARSAAIYADGRRLDITVREGVPRLLAMAEVARVAARALRAAGAPSRASLGVTLSADDELAALNAEHMGERAPTDVLSFPLLPPEAFPTHPGARRPGVRSFPPFVLPPAGRPNLGDIVISVERAIAQADAGLGGQTGDVRWSPADELRLLVIHGALHICGWDHADPVERDAMRALEHALLQKSAERGAPRATTSRSRRR
jgi:probable rRNA maturation factor